MNRTWVKLLKGFINYYLGQGSKYCTKSHVMPFIISVYMVICENHILIFLVRVVHGYLVEIRVQFIFKEPNFTIISYSDPCLIISKDLIFFDFGEAASWANDSGPLVFVYLIIWNVVARIKNHNAVTVVVDVVVLYPTESSFYRKYSFGSRLENSVIQN